MHLTGLPMTQGSRTAQGRSKAAEDDGAPTKPATPRRPKPKLPDPTHGAPQAKSMARSRSMPPSITPYRSIALAEGGHVTGRVSRSREVGVVQDADGVMPALPLVLVTSA